MIIRVVALDGHPLILKAVEALCQEQDDIQLVATCGSGETGLSALRHHRPDVLLLDVNTRDIEGWEVIRTARAECPECRVVLLSAEVSDHAASEAMRLGVQGLCLKDAPPAALLSCLRAVARDEVWIDRVLATRNFLRHAPAANGDARVAPSALTARQRDIVRHVATGARNKEIARILSITEGTVKIHVNKIYDKLGLNNRVALAAYGRKHGLVA